MTKEVPPKLTQAQVIVVVLETNVPLLTVGYPDSIKNTLININNDITLGIDYEKPPDQVFLAVLIVYKFEV